MQNGSINRTKINCIPPTNLKVFGQESVTLIINFLQFTEQ